MKLKKAISKLFDELAELEFKIAKSKSDIVDNKTDLGVVITNVDKMEIEVEGETIRGDRTKFYTQLNEVFLMLENTNEYLDKARRELTDAINETYEAEWNLYEFGDEEI